MEGLIKDFLVWLAGAFADISKLLVRGSRTVVQLQGIKDAVQAVIDDRPFEVVFKETTSYLCWSIKPEKIRLGWQQLYAKWGFTLEIPLVPFTQKRIKAEHGRGRVLVFVWERLADASALPTLRRLFPAMKCVWEERDSPSSDNLVVELVLSGWMFVESSLNTPHTGGRITADRLKQVFDLQEAIGYGLPVYLLFSLFCREMFGSYPDINGTSRLLGSSTKKRGLPLTADFRHGSLFVTHLCSTENAPPFIGGRSAAV